MLRLDDVSIAYGHTQAVHSVSMEVLIGESIALVGANGAGKTTILRAISGLLPLTRGNILFDNRQIDRLSVEAIVRLGVCQVPEGRQLFADMTVFDNLLLGTYSIDRAMKKLHTAADLERVYNLFPVLKMRSSQLAGTLSGGEQQMLAIGRALMSRPRLLLLDEPSMGLAPLVMSEIFRVISDLREEGMTVLLVEQNARWALRICSRAYVLETGRVVRAGSSTELSGDESIKAAYLGSGYTIANHTNA